ncbi:MAG TPA: pyridoxamine 5'-phosphate oxidase family protein [Acidobacteriota bacterium]|nr:pyridoxamine 5'-phosphate oxidase family protein [Acidobacteriota bacterium]
MARAAQRAVHADMKHNEEHIESLAGEGAARKIRELAKAARYCLFGTELDHPPVTVRPMTVMDVDDAGSLWFLSSRTSHTNQHLAQSPRVQLFFVNGGSAEFLTIEGSALVHADRPTKERFWSPMVKTWFQDGIDDPDLTVLQVQPEGGHYWDTKHGKMVSWAKIAAGAVSGRTFDDGIQGDLRP